MHQTRRTHNAHNETQRRLEKTYFDIAPYSGPVFCKRDRRNPNNGFYAKCPKSNSGYWRWAKKRLHKIWRRKSIDKLTFTYKDAVGCSLLDL